MKIKDLEKTLFCSSCRGSVDAKWFVNLYGLAKYYDGSMTIVDYVDTNANGDCIVHTFTRDKKVFCKECMMVKDLIE